MTRFIAFYLPQFHPISENDKWYGKGFTEWTNVAKAKPLFKGHYQPHIPADLGFYDLRLKSTIEEQTKLAKKYGIEGFCYWHYWFGNGKRLLEKPFMDLVNNKEIDFKFSLAWANESWKKKLWNSEQKNQVIAKQLYNGEKDYIEHFYSLLVAFKDKRYIRVEDKLFFIIYCPLDFQDISNFIKCWRTLAKKEGLNDFYFVGKVFACRKKDEVINLGFDAVYDDNVLNIHHNLKFSTKIRLKIQRDIFHYPTTFEYKEAIKHMIIQKDCEKNTIPLIAPNWDHSPRSAKKGIIFTHAEPKYFKKVVSDALNCISHKPKENQIIMIRAWNEWGEGNHLEPDLKYGCGYLEAIKQVLEKEENC